MLVHPGFEDQIPLRGLDHCVGGLFREENVSDDFVIAWGKSEILVPCGSHAKTLESFSTRLLMSVQDFAYLRTEAKVGMRNDTGQFAASFRALLRHPFRFA